MRAFIIGNGPSRLQIPDLTPLLDQGEVYGCNAIYRDFTPHILVAVDKNMVEEIIKAKYHEKNKCIFRGTRSSNIPNHENIKKFDMTISSPNNSGVAAAYWALKRQCAEVWLVGFDLGNVAGEICNVYEGTKGYENHKRRPPTIRRNIPEKLIYWTQNSGAKIYRCFDPKLSTKHEGLNDVSYEEFREKFGV